MAVTKKFGDRRAPGSETTSQFMGRMVKEDIGLAGAKKAPTTESKGIGAEIRAITQKLPAKRIVVPNKDPMIVAGEQPFKSMLASGAVPFTEKEKQKGLPGR